MATTHQEKIHKVQDGQDFWSDWLDWPLNLEEPFLNISVSKFGFAHVRTFLLNWPTFQTHNLTTSSLVSAFTC